MSEEQTSSLADVDVLQLWKLQVLWPLHASRCIVVSSFCGCISWCPSKCTDVLFGFCCCGGATCNIIKLCQGQTKLSNDIHSHQCTTSQNSSQVGGGFGLSVSTNRSMTNNMSGKIEPFHKLLPSLRACTCCVFWSVMQVDQVI